MAILANRQSHRQRPQGGRAWPAQRIDAILRGFGVYWLAWNAMLEPVADVRFQIERADYADLCKRAGVASDRCAAGLAAAARASTSFEVGKHGGDSMKVTWSKVDALDGDLSERMWALAQRYGYDRDPPARQG